MGIRTWSVLVQPAVDAVGALQAASGGGFWGEGLQFKSH